MGIECCRNNNENLNFEPKKPIICFNSLNAHKDKIVSLIELSSGKIATGSYDHTIKIWDLFNFECQKTIYEQGNVFCLLEFKHNYLLSGTDKNTIQLWNIDDSKNNYVCKYEGHSLWINCLVNCDENYFASCSNDSDIRIWDYNSSKCEKILKGHTDCVLTIIRLNEEKLCSGSSDLTIKVWNWKVNVCEMTFEESDDWIRCLYLLSNGYILSGISDGTIEVLDKENKIKNFKAHNNSIRSFCQIDDNHYASASFDQTIKIWDIMTNKCVNVLKGHKSNVIGIIYHQLSGYLISCSNDATLKFWKNKREK